MLNVQTSILGPAYFHWFTVDNEHQERVPLIKLGIVLLPTVRQPGVLATPQHLYPSQSLTWNLKMTPWNRLRTWKPSFLGFMLNLGSVRSELQKNLPLASVKLPTSLQTCTNHQISSRFFGFPGEGCQQTPVSTKNAGSGDLNEAVNLKNDTT